MAAVSLIYPPISSLQNSLLGGEQGGRMIRSVLADERAITLDTETRHLVHTWQDTHVLETVYKAP